VFGEEDKFQSISRNASSSRECGLPLLLARDSYRTTRSSSGSFTGQLLATICSRFRRRPTVFSGIDGEKEPHKQFLFSAAGLTTQALIDEAILDIPHSRGGAIERGILAGGIGTTLFYITMGRNGSVSDITVMARTSSLSKPQLSLIFGGFSAVHVWRISGDPKYSHFFVRPAGKGAVVEFSY